MQPAYYPKLLVLHVGLALIGIVGLGCRTRFLHGPLLLPAAVFLLLLTLSISQSVNRVESIVVLSHRTALVATFLSVAALIERRHVRHLLAAPAAAAAITALLGIGQYAGWFGLAVPTSGLPSATFGYRNFAAAFTVGVLPFAAVLALDTDDRRHRWAWTAVLFLNVGFLVATRARAAWGAAAVSAVVCLAFAWWKARRRDRPVAVSRSAVYPLAGAVLLAVVLAAVVPPDMSGKGYDTNSVEKVSITETVASTFQPGADKDRFTIWDHTLDMIADAPLTGVGPGNWQYVYPNYDRGDVTWAAGSPQRPHNDYLWIASETGLPGIACFIWLFVAAVGSARRAGADARDRHTFLPVLAAAGALTAVGMHALFSFPLERVPAGLLEVLSLSVLALADPASRRVSHASNVRNLVWAALIVSQTLAAGIAWRGLRFDRLAYRQTAAVARADWMGAVEYGTDALSRGVFDPQVLLERGVAYHMLGRFDEAIDDQERCLDYHPHFVNALNNLGMSLNGAGRFDDALDILGRVDPLDPDHVEVHLNRAKAFTGKSDRKAAIAELRRALEKGPGRTDVIVEIARLQEQIGALDEAAATMARAADRQPDRFTLQYRLGVILQKTGDLAGAADRFGRVLRLNPDYAPVYYNIGELHLARADTASALRAYEAFLDRWSGPAAAGEAVRRRIATLR